MYLKIRKFIQQILFARKWCPSLGNEQKLWRRWRWRWRRAKQLTLLINIYCSKFWTFLCTVHWLNWFLLLHDCIDGADFDSVASFLCQMIIQCLNDPVFRISVPEMNYYCYHKYLRMISKHTVCCNVIECKTEIVYCVHDCWRMYIPNTTRLTSLFVSSIFRREKILLGKEVNKQNYFVNAMHSIPFSDFISLRQFDFISLFHSFYYL